jgi:hypothetical protein
MGDGRGEAAYPRTAASCRPLSPPYLSLIDAETTGGLSEDESYSMEVMDAAAPAIAGVANQGALGMDRNSLMLNKALLGGLPETPSPTGRDYGRGPGDDRGRRPESRRAAPATGGVLTHGKSLSTAFRFRTCCPAG